MITLDVGTRSIICAEHSGTVITRIVHSEHDGVCMREGNVFDQPALVSSIRGVREKMNLPEGTEAGIAIAGGHLVTRRIPIEVASSVPLSESDLLAAENVRIAETSASKALAGKWLLGLMRAGFRCDGREVGSLIGMSGRGEYTLLATYLSSEQVRAKIDAIAEAGFAPVRITVESLAASSALFGSAGSCSTLPPDNFVVIDVGAGTSDIAFFSPHGILGASSVPAAGDKITEAIAARFGLATRDADSLKRNPAMKIRDLWGNERSFDSAEITAAGDEGARPVADAIAAELKKIAGSLSGDSVDASGAAASRQRNGTISGVIMVGGGSLWPSLSNLLAEALSLPANRVAIRPAETIAGIDDRTGTMKGPSFLTCIGMILSAQSSFRIVPFTINGARNIVVRRADRATLTIADAVEISGEDPVDYFGEPGEAMEVNGEWIGGEPGGDPEIVLNGSPATLDTPFGHDALIKIRKGAAGMNATPIEAPIEASTVPAELPTIMESPTSILETSASVMPEPASVMESPSPADPVAVELSDEPCNGFVLLDGKKIDLGERYRRVTDDAGKDRLEELEPPKLSSLLSFPIPRSLRIRVNGIEREIRDRTRSAQVNGRRLTAETSVPWNAEIDSSRPEWRLYELFAAPAPSMAPAALPPSGRSAAPETSRRNDLFEAPVVNGRKADYLTVIREGDEVTM